MQAANRPLYIFDLDGTLALIDHRRHLVEGPWVEVPREYRLAKGQRFEIRENAMYIRDPKFKPNWLSFYEACHLDHPNTPVIRTFFQLYLVGAEIMIWSGREDVVRQKTILWLARHTGVASRMVEQMLTMRPAGDYTPDEQLKRKWLNALPPSARARLTAVFDDRDKVVNMWRGEGVSCFQVAPGEF